MGRMVLFHKCPAKYFAESENLLSFSGLQRLLPCRDLNGDRLRSQFESGPK